MPGPAGREARGDVVCGSSPTSIPKDPPPGGSAGTHHQPHFVLQLPVAPRGPAAQSLGVGDAQEPEAQGQAAHRRLHRAGSAPRCGCCREGSSCCHPAGGRGDIRGVPGGDRRTGCRRSIRGDCWGLRARGRGSRGVG